MACIRMLLLALLGVSNLALAQSTPNDARTLVVAEPFIELHSGPGPAYPVLQVVDRGQSLMVMRQVTNWYLVRSDKQIEGWVNRDQLQLTLNPAGQQLELTQTSQSDFVQRDWELGVTTGELEKAPVMSIYLSRSLTPNMSLEVTLSEAIGNVSSSSLARAGLLMQPFSEWGVSPFFALGFGKMRVQPKVTLVNPVDRESDFGQVGLGLRKFINRNFVLRAEINQYVVFSATTERDDNEEIEEWKIGFAVFF
jgi:uncharacterized protein YgiM (DUF1202 family)